MRLLGRQRLPGRALLPGRRPVVLGGPVAVGAWRRRNRLSGGAPRAYGLDGLDLRNVAALPLQVLEERPAVLPVLLFCVGVLQRLVGLRRRLVTPQGLEAGGLQARRAQELPHHMQRVVRALPPVVRAEPHHGRVEAYPGAHDEARVHQQEPAVGAVLGGARLAGQLALPAEQAPDAAARALVHHALHHVKHALGHGLRKALAGFAAEARQLVALAVGDPRDEHRRLIPPAMGYRGVGGRHLHQRHLARAQPDGRHGLQLALDAEAAGHVGHLLRPHVYDELRGDRVDRMRQRVGQGERAPRDAAGVARRPPPARLRVHVLGRLILEHVARRVAFLQRRRVDERLERRARLPLRQRDVVVAVLFVIAAAHPRLDVPVGRVDGEEACFQALHRLLDRVHEGGVGAQRVQQRLLAHACLARGAVALRLPDALGQQIRLRLPEVSERLDLALEGAVVGGRPGEARRVFAAPLDGGHRLKVAAHLLDGLRGGGLQARVDGRVDAQAVGVEVVAVRVGPLVEPVAQVLGEERGQVVFVRQAAEV